MRYTGKLMSESTSLLNSSRIDRFGYSGTRIERAGYKHLLLVPVVMLHLLSCTLQQYLINQYIHLRYTEGGYSGIVSDTSVLGCAGNSTNQTDKGVAETKETTLSIIILLIAAHGIPGIFIFILSGSYSDTYGRKLFFYLPLMGTLAKAILSSVGAFYRISVYYFIFFVFIEAIFGSSLTTMCIARAYVGDITKPGRSRSLYMALLEMVAGVGALTGTMTSGHLIDRFGYAVSFVISAVMVFISLLVVLFILPESLINENKKFYTNIRERMKTVLSFYIKKPSESSSEKKTVYIICTLVLVLFAMILHGRPNVETWYQQNSPFCWDSVLIGWFFVTRMVVQSVIGIGFVRLAQYCWCDESIATIGAVTCLASFIAEAFAKTSVELLADTEDIKSDMYIAVPVIGIGSQVTAPMIRSIMSKMTSQKEQGSLFGGIGMIEVIAGTVSSALISVTFSHTKQTFRGSVFLVFTGLVLIALALLLTLRIKRYIRSKRITRTVVTEYDDIEDTIYIRAADFLPDYS